MKACPWMITVAVRSRFSRRIGRSRAFLRAEVDKVGVYVFPALEFSVNRCHLLAIWDRTDQGYQLAQQFLTTLWKPREDRFASNDDSRPIGHGQVMELAHRASGDYKALGCWRHRNLATGRTERQHSMGTSAGQRPVIGSRMRWS